MPLEKRRYLAALTVAFAVALAQPADAASGTVTAALEREGYARLVFDFDRLPRATAKIANNVLIVSFAEPVALSTAELGRGLGELFGVVRRDPDGTGLRIALNKPARLVSLAAGEKLFVDLLPTNWAGLPPPLPPQVIADLGREARAARDRIAEEARLKATPKTPLLVEGATHPTFRRLVFRVGADAAVDWRRDGPSVDVTIEGAFSFDADAARARLPLDFAGLEADQRDGALTIRVPAAGPGEARGFREDGDFILDIDRAAKTRGNEHAEAPLAAQPPAAPPPSPISSVVDAGHPSADAAPAALPLETVVTPAPPPRGAGAAPSARRVGETIRLAFPFERATAAAIFVRGDTLWAVFDDLRPLALDGLVKTAGGAVTGAEDVALDHGRLARLKLASPRLVSAAIENNDWIISLGEDVLGRSDAVDLAAGLDRSAQSAVFAELPGVGAVRELADPEVGDKLIVATLAPPARGVAARRSFVEFSALPSAQGLVIAPLADDLTVSASVDRVAVRRKGGLAVSLPEQSPPGDGEAAPDMAAAAWAEEAATASFAARENQLALAAAMAEPEDRPAARFALARFYEARRRFADAKGVLDAIVEDGGLSGHEDRLAIMRAAAEIELDRSRAALAILAAPAVKMKPEAALWRAAAEAALGRPAVARGSLAEGAGALAGLPPGVKARFVKLGVELALEAGDPAGATQQFAALEVLPAVEGTAARDLLRAEIAEASGQTEKAAAAYAVIARGRDPAAAARAELRAVALGLASSTLKTEAAIVRLERLVTGWRGDSVEAEALARLISLYGDADRWRDAFSTLRVAVEAFPDADGTRALQDRMQDRFTELFLGSGADRMPKLDALALFYDFKDMSPSGKRGDELVRSLADKLVEVELLDQAAELLHYQIENRLSGAARAQVAARAALVDLMNAKPGEALAVLRKTRQADLPSSLMKSRMRLEARALAETGRVDLALEMAAGLEGVEALRLKADILWAARRWPQAGEALETVLGSSWRGAGQLDPGQRSDAMRAAVAASLAGDGLAVDRIRQKFVAKMAQGPDASAFEVVTAPIEARGEAFRDIARSLAAAASFDDFLREYRSGAAGPLAQTADKPAARRADAS